MSAEMKNISLFIPHIFANYRRDDVVKIIEDDHKIGKVKHIDYIKKFNNGNDYYAAYIHFDYWNENEAAIKLQEDVLNVDKEAHIMYEDPWYWIVLENKTPQKTKTKSGDRKIRIDLGGASISKAHYSTPKKVNMEVLCPGAPAKKKPMSLVIEEDDDEYMETVTNLNYDFDEEAYAEMEQELDEIERYIEKEVDNSQNNHLVHIDSRYVKVIEDENAIMREQLYYLQSQMHNLQIYCLQNGLTLPVASPVSSCASSPVPV
jgi:hypothetical protein